MKKLIFVNGTMGAGKTSTCTQLLNLLDRCVFLDGDWCWNMHPFVVTEQTRAMVLDNITHLLANFLHCPEYDFVIFGWVMQDWSIARDVLARLPAEPFAFHAFTLHVSDKTLKQRLETDVARGIRNSDVIERSLTRIPLYRVMPTTPIDVDHQSALQAAQQIRRFLLCPTLAPI